MQPLITLTTDFGTRDWFAGTLKGVIHTLAPDARIIDITHEISPGDLRAAAFVLAAACRFFPSTTIHVAVVDPGVGTDRPAIAVDTPMGRFVGPDNGVLTWAIKDTSIRAIRRLANPEYFLREVSHTFHGRDIFAPVAAHLANGVSMARLGPPHPRLVRLPWPKAKRQGRRLIGEVIYVDRFGNAITNLPAAALRCPGGQVSVGREARARCVRAYGEGAPGELLALGGSTGYLEIARRDSSAAVQNGLVLGSPVTVAFGGAKGVR